MASLHDRVLDELGRAIVDGELGPGAVRMAEDLSTSHGVSRSVIREAVRVLGSMGLVETVKRVGVRVLPAERWNALDPLLIRWRLGGPGRADQLRSLTELRASVEPGAARLAAARRDDGDAEELVGLSARMTAVGRAGDLDGYLELDVRFHAIVLGASGNELFRCLTDTVAGVLRGRTAHGLMPERPHEDALELHRVVADAIAGGDGERAAEAMDRIMRRTMAEVDELGDA